MPDKLSTQFKYQRLDRTTCRLNGYIVAEYGDFKTGRGSFSAESLKKICELINAQPNGVKCHFGHDNQLGKFLGRARTARITGVSVRADLYFDKTAMEEPPLGGGKPLGQYVMDLAESDPGALNSSLILSAEKTPKIDPVTGKKDFDAPPIWMPTEIFGSDIVANGDATHGGLLQKESDAFQKEKMERLRQQQRRNRLWLMKAQIQEREIEMIRAGCEK